ncbi:D-alanyl-D-alanine carboxypeptidase family protein [Virgibacillus sp. C22-A2]|uniref:D-alanyl-D-alanine carboxypeptidase family protein n=1 Tax=Virgibacillus tibetensis TaxID=3042313 RepID=A0ABU6KIF4_9BACI|nr:D-alanyl-D-alanine carboxypeptidase family protein [Virgibacillus sp. C22-A2]
MKKITIILIAILAINPLAAVSAHSGPESPKLTLLSEAAILMEADSGEILYDKNADEIMYPASLTKIATTIYVIETADLDEIATVSSNARNTEGTSVFLEEGEQVSLEKLIKGLLINSGNDAGVAIAEHLSGSVENFSSDMTAYFKNKLGTDSTNFKNPHGLFDPEHVTTAEDLARITQYAMKNDLFMEIFSKRELEWEGKTWDTTIINHHKLVKGEIPYDGITGGKNGYVSKSGFTLITTSEKENLNLIAVTLKNNNQNAVYNDTMDLLDYGFDQFRTATVPEGAEFAAGDEVFTAPEKLAYTYPLTEEVREDVSENGTLEISSRDGEVIASYPLEKVNNKNDREASAAMKNTSIQDTDSKSIFDYFPFNPAYLLLLFILILGIFYRFKRKYS